MGMVSQYQEEIPVPRVERTKFRIHVGRCEQCGKASPKLLNYKILKRIKAVCIATGTKILVIACLTA